MKKKGKLELEIKEEMARRLFQLNSNSVPMSEYPKYVRSPEQILIHGLEFDLIKPFYDSGDGGELRTSSSRPPKFQAAYSSSALVVNTFAPFIRKPEKLSVFDRHGFEKLSFEYKCPTGLRKSPNLDLILWHCGEIIGVESKLAEPFKKKTAKFSESYNTIIEKLPERSWEKAFHFLKDNPDHYTTLDAGQLVKHYLGLRNTFAGKEISLMYLYWEPKNADRFTFFCDHRDEALDFSNRVKESDIEMIPVTYKDIWEEIEIIDKKHVDALRMRYELNI